MAEYFVFFRCWPGFSDPFPIEQFNGLPDEEVGPALKSFAQEQLKLPDVRAKVNRVGKQALQASCQGNKEAGRGAYGWSD